MALGSGSSLATDRWIMRWGFFSSEKLLRVGSATRLHQHSSQKPTAHRGSASATSINRSLAKLAFFSFLQGVWGGDPAFRPLPAYPQQAREGGAYGLPRDPPPGQPFLESDLRGHLQSPQARLVSELPRGAVQKPPQGFGALPVEGGVDMLRTGGAGGEGVHAPLVEGVDGVARRLGAAPEALGDLGRREAAGAGQQYLGSAHHEGFPGAQPRLEVFALLL